MMSKAFRDLVKTKSGAEITDLTKLAISRKRHRFELWLTWALLTTVLLMLVYGGLYLLHHFGATGIPRFAFFILAIGATWAWFKLIVLSVFFLGERAVVRESKMGGSSVAP
jgi:hypothetical protein